MLGQIKKVPFIRFLVPLILGIVVSDSCDIFGTKSIAISYSLVFIIFILVSKFLKSYSKQHWIGILLIALLFLYGAFNYKYFNSFTEINTGSEKYFYCIATDFPQEKTKSYKIEVKIKKIGSDSSSNLNVKSILYFEKDTNIKNIQPGAELLISTNLQRIQNNGNPNEFNYQRFNELKKIYYTGYVRANAYKILGVKNNLQSRMLGFRNQLINVFVDNEIRDKNLAIISALTLGEKDLLDPEIKHSFQNSGLTHILAVSGLHVGIIYLLLCSLFSKIKVPVYIHVISIITLLWLYALLTGLGPSVKRASLMFSFFTFSRFLKHQYNNFNLIAASAFFILILNPNSLFMPGFQLSYFAVISIVYFYPKFSQVIFIKNKILKYFWDLSIVSICAQIGTAPLSIYYFNQFPLLFLGSNILILPIVPVLIYGAFILLATSPLHFLSGLVGKLLNIICTYVSTVSNKISHLEFSSLSNIHLLKAELYIIYVSIILVPLIFKLKKKYLFFGFLFACLLFVSVNAYDRQKQYQKNQIIVYNSNQVLISLKINDKVYFLNEDKDLKSLDFLTREYIVSNRLKRELYVDLDSIFFDTNVFVKQGFMQIESLRFCLLSQLNLNQECLKQLNIDYLIIDKYSGEINKILGSNPYKMVLLHPKLNKIQVAKIQELCKKNGLEIYNLRNLGAFKINLEKF